MPTTQPGTPEGLPQRSVRPHGQGLHKDSHTQSGSRTTLGPYPVHTPRSALYRQSFYESARQSQGSSTAPTRSVTSLDQHCGEVHSRTKYSYSGTDPTLSQCSIFHLPKSPPPGPFHSNPSRPCMLEYFMAKFGTGHSVN